MILVSMLFLILHDDSEGIPGYDTCAWPIRLPGGAVRPAMNATTGLGLARSCCTWRGTRGVLLHGAADLSDEDDALGLVVVEEELDEVDGGGAREGVAADADAEGLAEADLGSLVDGLVGEGAGAGDDADAAGGVDGAGHDADLAAFRVITPGQLGPTRRDLDCERRAAATRISSFWGMPSVMATMRGTSFSMASIMASAAPGEGRRDGSVRLGLTHGLLDRAEDGEAEVGLTGLLGRDTANELGAVFEGLLAVEGAGLAGEALADDAGVLVDEQVLDRVLVRARAVDDEKPRASGRRSETAACLNMLTIREECSEREREGYGVTVWKRRGIADWKIDSWTKSHTAQSANVLRSASLRPNRETAPSVLLSLSLRRYSRSPSNSLCPLFPAWLCLCWPAPENALAQKAN